MAEQPSRYYRLVRTNPPTTWDFLSNQAKGRPPRRPEILDPSLYAGVSVFDDRAAAAAFALRRPAWIAALELRPSDRVRITKTGRHPNHYTVHADPAVLLAAIVGVMPVP